MAASWACAVDYVIKGTFLRPGFWSGVLLGFEPSLANHYSMIRGMKFAKVRRPVMHIVHIEYRSIWFLQCGHGVEYLRINLAYPEWRVVS